MAEGNALGKGPVIFHLFDSGIELIRRKAAGASRACTIDPLSRHRHACMHPQTPQSGHIDRQADIATVFNKCIQLYITSVFWLTTKV